MEHNYLFEHQIEVFLSGKMTSDEQTAFKKALSENPDWAKTFALRQLEFEVAENIIAQDLRRHLQQLKTNKPTTSTNPFSKKKAQNTRWLLLLTGALLLLIGGLYWWASAVPASDHPDTNKQPAPTMEGDPTQELPPQEATPDKTDDATLPPPGKRAAPTRQSKAEAIALSKAWYSEPDFSSLRHVSPPAADTYEQALDAWHSKDFKRVVQLLDNTPDGDPNIFRVKMLLAHAHYQSGGYQEAFQLFHSIADSQLLPWAEEAQWYALLSLLALDQAGNKVFQSILQNIRSSEAHPYYHQAMQLEAAMSK